MRKGFKHIENVWPLDLKRVVTVITVTFATSATPSMFDF
jgi:hypothetical protein